MWSAGGFGQGGLILAGARLVVLAPSETWLWWKPIPRLTARSRALAPSTIPAGNAGMRQRSATAFSS